MTSEDKIIDRFIDENHNHCTNCGYEFKEFEHKDELCYIGYDKLNQLSLCCEKCKDHVERLVSKKSFYERTYGMPKHDDVLWRYMDLAKYISLLSSSKIFLARIDTFDDPLEGAQGLSENKHIWDAHYLEITKNAIKHLPDGTISPLSDNEIDKQAKKLVQQLNWSGKYLREKFFVSCWHQNQHESQAMWRLYSTVLSNAVAVKTTYKRLSRAIDLDIRNEIEIGQVKYIDFKTQFSGVNNAIWRKDVSFVHEREVRLLYIGDLNSNDIGKSVPVDLSTLIEDVYISPEAPTWFKDVVNDINKKYGINTPVSDSELKRIPFF